MNDPACPSRMEVRVKASNTDFFWQRISLFIGRETSDLCSVSAMLACLVMRGNQEGPLFKFLDGRPLTRQWLVMAVKEALDDVGVEAGHYSGHSFRIGDWALFRPQLLHWSRHHCHSQRPGGLHSMNFGPVKESGVP